MSQIQDSGRKARPFKFIAFFIMLSFVSMALIMPSQNVRADTLDDVVIIGASASAGAAIGAAVGDGVGAVVGAAAGAILGYVLLESSKNKLADALESETKQIFANNIIAELGKTMAVADAAGENQAKNLQLTELYFARKAEWAAKALYDYQELNNLAHNYDSDWVLSRSYIFNSTAFFTYQTMATYSGIIDSYSSQSEQFIGDFEGMNWGIGLSRWESDKFSDTITSTMFDSSESVGNMVPVFGLKVECSNYTKLVAVPDKVMMYIVNPYNTEENATISVYDHNAVKIAEFKGHDNKWAANVVNYYPLIELSNITESGRYSFISDNPKVSIILGGASKDMTNSGTLTPVVFDLRDTDPGGEGENQFKSTVIIADGKSWPATNEWIPTTAPESTYEMAFFVGSTIPTPEVQAINVLNYTSIQKSLEVVKEIVDATSAVLSHANAYASSYFNLLKATGGEGTAPMPDIVFPDPNSLIGMTPEQIYAIYIAYMNQLDDWFLNYTKMDAGDVNLSVESMELYCRGMIYDENGLVVEPLNTVFTPYISLDDMELVLGNNTMSQPGFSIIWGSSPTLAAWERITNLTYITMKANYTLHIDEMFYKGAAASSVNLTVAKISYLVANLTGFSNQQGSQSIGDVQWFIAHWYYIAIVGGVLFLLVSVMTRSTPIIIIGLVLLAAGIIGYYIASPTMWNPFANLSLGITDWIQGLR